MKRQFFEDESDKSAIERGAMPAAVVTLKTNRDVNQDVVTTHGARK